MLPYLKLFTETRNDAKLRSLTDAQFRVFVNLLCYVAEQPDRGKVEGFSKHLVAIEVANGNLDLLVETCNALGALHVVTWCYRDENNIEISLINFEKRQAFGKPSSHPEKVRERVARSRAAKRSGSKADNVTPCNAPVTPLLHPCNDIKTQIKREKENTIPPYTPPPDATAKTCVRSGDDLAQVNQAIALLASDARTEHLGLELGRVHNTARLVGLAGWKWLRAARWLLEASIEESKRRNFAYLKSIAGNLTDADRDEAPARRETAGEKKAREMAESMGRRMAKEAARGQA